MSDRAAHSRRWQDHVSAWESSWMRFLPSAPRSIASPPVVRTTRGARKRWRKPTISTGKSNAVCEPLADA